MESKTAAPTDDELDLLSTKGNIRFAYFLGSLWFLILLNNSFPAQFVFESPRIQGYVYILWLVIPWPCIIIAVMHGRVWLKILASLVAAFWGLFSLCAFLASGTAMDLISTDQDIRLQILSSQKLDQRRSIVEYRYDPGRWSSCRRIWRDEVEILPGVKWTNTFKSERSP